MNIIQNLFNSKLNNFPHIAKFIHRYRKIVFLVFIIFEYKC